MQGTGCSPERKGKKTLEGKREKKNKLLQKGPPQELVFEKR